MNILKKFMHKNISMKKLVIALSFILVSCGNDKISISKEEYDKLRGVKVVAPEYPKLLKVTDFSEDNLELYTILIDSCEYISSWSLHSNTAILAHKGNCKFCRQKQEDSYRRIIREELEKIKK